MKVMMEFNLPEDVDEYTLAYNSRNLYLTLSDFDDMLRSDIKYNDKLSEEVIDTIIEIRDKLYQCMIDNNISFDMVS